MGFRHGVTLEAVLIPALFLTHLTVPAQLLKPFGLHPIGQVLDASFLRLGHFGGIFSSLHSQKNLFRVSMDS